MTSTNLPPTQYAVLVVSNLSRSLEDNLVDLFFSNGAEGVAEDLKFEQKDLRYDPEVQLSDRMSLNVYLSQIPDEQAQLQWQQRIRLLAPEAKVSFKVEAEKDWLEEWKKGFKPFLFAAPFWVVPRWCEWPQEVGNERKHVLLMEPGMAFGTGTHETTRLAAAFVADIVQSRVATNKSLRLLDVGTGTGILALMAERIGAHEAIGLDIDPEARRTARENLELNQSTRVKIDDRDLAAIATETKNSANGFDVVIANIIDGVLLTLAKDLRTCLASGGTLILSGILTDRENQFHSEFSALTGLQEIKRTREGEWCASIWRA